MSNQNEEEVLKTLAEKYESIKKLVDEYNKTAKSLKIDTRVGCVINEESEDSEDNYYSNFGFSAEGWMPSSIGC